MRWLAVALLGVVVVTATAVVEAGEQGRRPHRWWQSDEVKTLLDLTEDQSTRLDTIFRKMLPQARESMRRLNAEEARLSQLIEDMEVEEIDVTRQIDRVEAARSELSKSRILMVFRMHRVLGDAQRDALHEWQESDATTGRPEPRRRNQRR